MTATNEFRQLPQTFKILSKRCAFGPLGAEVELSLTAGEEQSMTEAGMLEKVRPTTAADKKGK